MKQWPQIVAIGLVLIIFALAPVAYRYTARLTYDCDPFTYAQNSKELVAGMRLYSEIATDKGPLTAIGFAIPEFFFPRNYPAIGTFLGLLLIAQSIILFWKFRSNPPAVVAITFLLTIFPLVMRDFVWLGTEHLSNIFVASNLVVAYAIARARKFNFIQCFLVGAFSCLALNTRQTALLSGLVPAVAIAMYGGSVRRVLAGGAISFLGGIAAMAVVIYVVSCIGDVHEFLNTIFLHPAHYAGVGSPSEGWRMIRENLTGPLGTLAIVFFALGIFSPYPVLASSAVIAGILSVALPGRYSIHYFVGLFPYIALLIGIGLERHAANSPIFCWACVAFMIYVACGPIQLTLKDAREHPFEIEMATVAHHIDRVAPPNATLLVWGKLGSEPIVFNSSLPRAHKYWTLWMLQAPIAQLLPVPVKDIFADYLAKPPTVMAMDQDFVKHMNEGTRVPNYDEAFELGKDLLRKFQYKVVDSFGGYDIAILVAGGSPTKPATNSISN